jgi:hypothetical protein
MLSDFGFLLELIKAVGFPAVIFIIWYIYHKSQVEFYKQILNEQAERENRNFEVLRELTETIQATTAILSRMEYKIDSNTYCPITKEGKK